MTTARPILGRGLDALIPRSHDRRDEPAPHRVAIDQIDPNPEQPRGAVDPAALEELAASVRAIGVLQPLLVTAGDGGRFTLVDGERRWRAARLAGLREVPVVVTSLAGDELLTAALVENVQREDLSPLEEAGAYARLLAATGESQARIAERVGKSRSAVANSLRLLGLPAPIRDSLARAEISEGHARALLAVTDPAAREGLWQRIVAQGLNVRQAERGARALNAAAVAPTDRAPADRAPAEPGDPSPDADADAALIADLERALGTRVRLHRNGRGGSLEIRWYDDEQLGHLAGRLTAPAAGTLPPPPAHLTI